MAQQESSENNATKSPYKLEKGSVTTELNFSPFGIISNIDNESLSFGSFTMPALRLRYAFSNKLALRANIGLDFGHNKINENLDNISDEYYYKRVTTGKNIGKSNYTEFSFAPGIEYHFGKWERLSLYVGGELFLGFKITQSTADLNKKVLVYEKNGYDGLFYLNQEITTISTIKTKNCSYSCDSWGCYYDQTGIMFFGINALTGFDVYIYKGLYLGAEISLGYVHSWALKSSVKGNSFSETKTYNQTIKTETPIDEIFDDKIVEGRLAFKCNPMIRLGWRF